MKHGKIVLAALLLIFSAVSEGAFARAEAARPHGLVLPVQNAREEMRSACARFFLNARETPTQEEYEELSGVERSERTSLPAPQAEVDLTANEYRLTTVSGMEIERTYTAYARLDGTVYRLTCEGPAFVSMTPWGMEDLDSTRIFMHSWLQEVGWPDAQIVEIKPYPVDASDEDGVQPGHEVLLWFPGGEETRVKVLPASGSVSSVMWSEQAPSGQPTREAENAWYERQAREALKTYLDIELPDETLVTVNRDGQYSLNSRYPVWGTRTIEFSYEAQYPFVYRVDLNGDGVRRVQCAYQGADGSKTMEDLLQDWHAQWAQNDPEQIIQMESSIAAYLAEKKIAHEPWVGARTLGPVLSYVPMEIARDDTDIYLIYSYAKPGGKLYCANEYLQVGYSLYQKRIAFVDLCVDGNG